MDINEDCGTDESEYCPDVYMPGCVINEYTAECDWLDGDPCYETDTLEADDTCLSSELSARVKAMLEGTSTINDRIIPSCVCCA